MGKPIVYTTSMATNASLTGSIDFGNSFYQIALEIASAPGLSVAGTPIYVQGSSDGTTFRRYAYSNVNTSTTGTNDFVVGSGTSNRMVPLPNFVHRYMQLEISGVVTAATWVFKVTCQNSDG